MCQLTEADAEGGRKSLQFPLGGVDQRDQDRNDNDEGESGEVGHGVCDDLMKKFGTYTAD
jgi:hypothetical protein